MKKTDFNEAKNKVELLAKSSQSGDKLAFVDLLSFFSPFIFSMAHRYKLPSDEYEDLCQIGRIALYKAVCSYNSERQSFTTFGRTCIKNAMVSFIRKYYAENKLYESNVSLDDLELENTADTSESTPEDTLIANEFIEDLQSAILTTLSEAERQVLFHKMSGFGTQEISIIIGKDVKSVENTLFRARKKLKEHLNNNS